MNQLCLPLGPRPRLLAEAAFELREYQEEVVRQLYRLLNKGKRRPFIYAPTGAGKTAIASKIVDDAVKRGKRVLFLVHREPLVEQTRASLLRYDLEAGVIKAGYRENREMPIQIASIQSLGRRYFPPADLVVVDECHTVSWYNTFSKIKDAYPKAFFIGLTASPWRSKKNEYMGEHFDSFVKAPSLAELILMGFLTQPRHFGFGGFLDLAKIDNGRDGDFNDFQVQQACMEQGYNERIVAEFVRLCSDEGSRRTAIAFCSGVAQSQYLCGLFNDSGVAAEHLDANTPHSDRQQIYGRLAASATRVLCSVGTLTEGFDEPSIGAVILARPTKSLALLIQMAGRGLRIFPGKKDCLLLDFGDNFARMGFVTDSHPIRLEPVVTEPGEAPVKECPSCHFMVYNFLMICPCCGHEFERKGADSSDDEEFDLEFGELFSLEDKEKLKYLRRQIRTKYKRRQPIDRIWKLFYRRYGHNPPNAWHLGAVFGTHRTEVNRQKYLDYLYEINKRPDPDWLKFHMRLEFGEPGRRYQTSKGAHIPPPNQHWRLQWWDVLEVLPLADWSQIKFAYRLKAKEFHPDVCLDPDAKEGMQLVNWAFEKAKECRYGKKN